jgi:hypothetical protein
MNHPALGPQVVGAAAAAPAEPMAGRVTPSRHRHAGGTRCRKRPSHAGPAQRSLALQPAHSRSHLMTLSIGSFSQVVAFPTAPIATGWSDPCRKGLAPSQELRLSTAHGCGFASNPATKLNPGYALHLPPRPRQAGVNRYRRARRRKVSIICEGCSLDTVQFGAEIGCISCACYFNNSILA